jgi:ABC-type thiamine transport system ATPase subunit
VAGIRFDGLEWYARERYGLAAPPGGTEAGPTVPGPPIVVEPGEVIAVVVAAARVGAALADVLVGLAPPCSGTVTVAGTVIAAGGTGGGPPPRRPNPQLVALIPAGGALLPHLSVAANIGFGDRFHADRGAREGQVTELAELFRVAGVLRLHPHRLSPAQRLGVAAARALGSDPHVVVVEDRAGQPDPAAVVATLARRDRAVIVITDQPADHLTSRVLRPEPAAPVAPARELAPAVDGGRDAGLA